MLFVFVSKTSGSKCTLERGLCSWSNTQNGQKGLEKDQLDWELTNQEAERHFSTPPHDHTLGTERGEPDRDDQSLSSFGCGYCRKSNMFSCQSCVSLLIENICALTVTRRTTLFIIFKHKYH